MKSSGVYSLTNRVNGKRYIGSTVRCLHERKVEHRRNLRKGTHLNIVLQRAWNKYGERSFKFETLEECQPERCLEREQYWIDFYGSTSNDGGYNVCAKAGSVFGYRFTEEQRKARSELMKGKKQTLGKKLSVRARANMSRASTGRYHTAETKRRMSEIAKARWAKNKEGVSV